MKTKKQKWGGSRKGAGRPQKAPTKTLSYRVPVSHAGAVDREIRKLISKLNNRAKAAQKERIAAPVLFID